MKIKELRRLIISKRLNILLGSGCSTPAIPLMGEFWKKCDNKDKANEELEEKIKSVSEVLVDPDLKKSDCNDQIKNTLDVYVDFVKSIIEILNLSNARETPRRANIFTTNYDLFLEKAFDMVSQDYRFIINDGAKGYFNRALESSNFDQVVSYKGINDNYISEIPSISLIKPHGSVNWDKDEKNERVYIRNNVVTDPLIVKPTGFEANDTFNQNHFFSMLRFFTNELDKEQSVLLVIGFSFQDEHIARMVKRAIANPELMVICFCFTKKDVKDILKNLHFNISDSIPTNISFLIPKTQKDKIDNEEKQYNLQSILCDNITLKVVNEFLNGVHDNDDEKDD